MQKGPENDYGERTSERLLQQENDLNLDIALGERREKTNNRLSLRHSRLKEVRQE